MSTIGLLNEKPLHAALKAWYAQAGDELEVAVDGYVIDIVRGDLLLEIQTGSFSALKTKLHRLLDTHRLRLIHPIAQEKWILKPGPGADDAMSRRKSPKRGRIEDLFRELVSFPHLLNHRNFSLEVLLIHAEEVWRVDETRGWRRRGWRVDERRLLRVVERHVFAEQGHWRALLPATLADPFTTRDLTDATGIQPRSAQQMAYCLREMGVIRLVGKRGRFNLMEKC
ncbi:MAG: hypothetical protein KDD83_13595 [Caldilineaceae bacterium]|nr:hypothetical protein [Caldilineaceae bacterium]